MERTTLIVLDASVALKWFLIEDDTDKALQIRDLLKSKYIPIVPSVFYYEISNMLRYKKEFGINDVRKVIQSLRKFQFKIEEFQGDFIHRTIQVAYIYGITIYDASYVALNEIVKGKLITADEKLFNKVVDQNIVLLKNWNETE